VPDDSPCCIEVAKLPIDKFDIWELYRNMLLVKAAPLIQQLPKEELLDIIEKMTIKEYKPGEYIIRQGDQGDEFFIIREGSVKIVDETIPSLPRVLTTLKEGHFFGEMAYPSREKALLASGKLAQKIFQNRLILRKAMVHGGFMPIQYEWWHFNDLSDPAALSGQPVFGKDIGL
jgi:hypothetical protein